jgi:hypothetical protein
MPMVTLSIASPSVPLTIPEIVAVCDFAAVMKQVKINRICVLRAFRNFIR